MKNEAVNYLVVLTAEIIIYNKLLQSLSSAGYQTATLSSTPNAKRS